ncbi:MAG: cytochrome c oxidase subunit 3 [Vicingaceae bacterium]
MENQTKNIYYPPGGILLWFIIILELFTFLGAALLFVAYRKDMLQEFSESKEILNPIIGTVNTIILITSGYFMALSVNKLREDNKEQSALYILLGLILGLAFLVVKGFEYYHKIELGIGFNYNTFFTFYWLMTGFHFVHVLFGVGLLAYMYFAIKKGKYSAKELFDVEASATYWHMCDLIWILIFPVLYLI